MTTGSSFISRHRDKLWLGLAIAFFAIVSFFTDQMDNYVMRIVILAGINIILATSLNLINGFTGQFSLGHAGFMSIGAYVSAVITIHLGPKIFGDVSGVTQEGLFFLALVSGGCAAALAGLLVGIPSLRLKGDYLAIVTLGFGEIIRALIENFDYVGGPRGLSGIPPYTSFLWVFSLAAVVVFVVSNLVNSTYGRGFLAVRDDEVAAEAMGINTTKYKVTAFVIGAFFAGMAGGLQGHLDYVINPSQFNFLRSVEIVVLVILGGMGSIPGVILAAIVMTILPEVLRGVEEYRMIMYSLLLIILMITRPQGLFGGGMKFKLSKQQR